mmetsp:Transcript_52619/g.93899  ORF Transcript_52619/g.93899 Transcript_52619/m.93899 type:complete len:83 (-) Transcript_52619:682-930(-)
MLVMMFLKDANQEGSFLHGFCLASTSPQKKGFSQLCNEHLLISLLRPTSCHLPWVPTLDRGQLCAHSCMPQTAILIPTTLVQ